jgi:hypothetical protein
MTVFVLLLQVLTHKEKIDNVAELKAIYHKACAAFKSVLKLVRSEIGAKESEGVLGTAVSSMIIQFQFNFNSIQFN